MDILYCGKKLGHLYWGKKKNFLYLAFFYEKEEKYKSQNESHI